MNWRTNNLDLRFWNYDLRLVWKSQWILFFLSFSTFSQTNAIIFIHPECPISQQYLHKIEVLAEEFKTTEFQLIIPPKGISKKQIEDFKNEYSIKIPIKIDKKSKLIKQLGATITPEVFVLNAKNEVLYSGMVDSWFYDLGKRRAVATEFYLRDVLLGNNTIKKTTAVGCLIGQAP
jgi:hypothetical protein